MSGTALLALLPVAFLTLFLVMGMTRAVAWRASFFLTPEMNRKKRLAGSRWERWDFSLVHYPASLLRPRVHASCWYIAPCNSELLYELLDISKDRAEKFGKLLPQLAAKIVNTPEDKQAAKWERVMEFADRSPEEHEVLATPGYSLTVTMTAVAHGLPLDYAEAMCSSSDHLSLVGV